MSSKTILEVQAISHPPIHQLSFKWTCGIHWICGDEGSGKTTLLKLLANELKPKEGVVSNPETSVFWFDPQIQAYDEITVQSCWHQLSEGLPNWNETLLQDLAREMDMLEHSNKRLNMLSTGSRRKVGILAGLASGATATLLDQPFAALDMRSIHVIKEFLNDMFDHPSRAWIVADYSAPTGIALTTVLNLDRSDS